MIRFYFNASPNPLKVALFLEEAGLPYEKVPLDPRRGEQHEPAFRRINPNGKVPAIVDEQGPGGRPATVFDSNAILLYLAEKTGQFLGAPEDRPQLLSWLMFVATGLSPFSGQSVHFQKFAPEPVAYAINRYRREVERHYRVLDGQLRERPFVLGQDYTIVDMAAWGWLVRADFALPPVDGGDPLDPFPELQRWFRAIDARPAAQRARTIGQGHAFKQEMDEAARRAMFPSNYPPG